MTEKFFLGVYNNKPNVIQVSENNYIDFGCLFSQKKDWFWKTDFCSNLTEKFFLGVYNNKPNVIQVSENNYIDFGCLFSQKKDWFWKTD